MIPFVLGAVVGGIAVTALGESKIGKKISKEGTRLIDTLDDRITALAKKVDEDHEICKTLKSGYENVSTRLNTLIKTTGEKLSSSIEEGKEYFASVTEHKEANPVKETDESGKQATKSAVDKKKIVKKSTIPKKPQPVNYSTK